MNRLVPRLAAAAVVAGGIAAAAWWWLGTGSGDGVAVPTLTVTRTEFRRAVPADGNLKAVEATPITAPQDARMPLKIAWMVEDGSRIEEGEVVVRFDPTEMEQRLRDGRESVVQADSRIAKEQALSSAAQRKRDREAMMAELEMNAAREFESKDEDIFSRHEIIESQVDVELAGARMEHAKSVKGIERSVSSGKLEVLGVQERQAQMEVDRASTALSNLELTAPHDGLLLVHRDWQGRAIAPGDTVWPGMKIAEVPGVATMEAEVYVLEADGGSLAEGMSAMVMVESQPGVEYPATIKRVDTLAQPRDPEVPVQYFTVILSLEETDAATMNIGQRVRATIVLDQTEALVVPRQAVFTGDDGSFVYRRGPEGFERVPVTLGSATAGRVVIAEGLAEGDEIALAEPPSGGGPDAGAEARLTRGEETDADR